MVNTQAPLVLKGRSIYCRPFTVDDINETYLSWLNDPVVNEFSRRLTITSTREDAVRFVESFKKDEVLLGIFTKDQDQHIGNIQYGPVDWVSRYAEIRIMVGEKSVWGRGFGTEAIYIVTRYLFRELDLHRVEANTCNPAFERCVKKLGWSMEGRLRERFRLGDKNVDFLWFGLLKPEFKILRQFEPL
jgi:RimJ/RimL family protein N-acetyltransferase